MKDSFERHQSDVKGTLSCFDRLLFRGYLPGQQGWQMASFLNQRCVHFARLKEFLIANGLALKAHAKTMAERAGRPYRYLERKIPMEAEARRLAETDGITEGLVVIFAVLEPCRTFSFRYEKGQPFARPAVRKCVHFYYYVMDPEFGLVHLRLQTWFPISMQVYVHGHEWLARKLAALGIAFAARRRFYPALGPPPAFAPIARG